MKRDMNLIREIMIALEAESSGSAPDPVEIDGYTDEQINYHTLLLIEAGLVVGKKLRTSESDIPYAFPSRITWKGHEFLDEARDKNRWKEALQVVQQKGGGAVSIGVLTQLLSALAKQSLGLG